MIKKLIAAVAAIAVAAGTGVKNPACFDLLFGDGFLGL